MITIPPTLRSRPRWGGYHVPFFVSWYLDDRQVDERTPGAKPDFRVVSVHNASRCLRHGLCWICGTGMGANRAFVFGPLAALHRLSAEPPSHLACAEYAVQTCPHMINPAHRIRESNLPSAPGITSDERIDDENPGMFLIWVTKRYWPAKDDPKIISVGEPHRVQWWIAGHLATHHEAVEQLNLTVAKEVERVARTYFDASKAPAFTDYCTQLAKKVRPLHALLPLPPAAIAQGVITDMVLTPSKIGEP